MSFSDPRKIIQELGLREGMRVADLGAGSGHYTFVAAQKVGGNGRVYVVDIQKEVLTRLKREAESSELLNVEIIWGDIDELRGTRLADGAVDAVILTNVLFQLEHRNVAVAEVHRILKPGGKALVVDWSDSFGGIGPAAGNILSAERAQTLFLENKFTFVKDIQALAGDHHYGFIFTKA